MSASVKKTVQILFLLLFVLTSCHSYEPDSISVDSITLNTTFMEMNEGESCELIATISPSNANNKIILWTTSNSSVAVVHDGIITAYKAGTAIITAKSDEGGKTATCEIRVINPEVGGPNELVDENKGKW